MQAAGPKAREERALFEDTGEKQLVEIWGIEPQTFHMQSERSTTELYPLAVITWPDRVIARLCLSALAGISNA